MQVTNFSFCPQCHERTLEHLSTHTYCIECNYSPTLSGEEDPAIPEWALEALRNCGEVETPEQVAQMTFSNTKVKRPEVRNVRGA